MQVVDAEEWEDALNSSMLLADMFEVDTECVGDRLGQVDLLLEQVRPATRVPFCITSKRLRAAALYRHGIVWRTSALLCCNA